MCKGKKRHDNTEQQKDNKNNIVFSLNISITMLFLLSFCCFILSLVVIYFLLCFYVVVSSIMYKKRYFLNRLRTTNHACIITVGTKP